MSRLIKLLLYAIVLAFLGFWIFTVAKSCKATKNITEVIDRPINSAVDDVKDNLDDLYDDEDEGEGNGELDGELDAESEEDLYDDEIGEEDVDAAKKAAMAEVEEEDEEEEDGDELTSDLDEEESDNDRSVASSGGGSSGKYMVVAGSYLSEANAKSERRRLQKAGYDDAEVVVFNFSNYHTVCAARYNSLSEANALKGKLANGRYPDAYVHRKRSRKK